MSQSTKEKKAFTLTELLVVVVVIGVLAAVALPKFNKVMETRKITEAEEIMANIRTEQERRCALDKPYTMDFDKLSNNSFSQFSANQAETSHFTYGLEGIGMMASSKGKYNYQLKMPSYADGRLCCSGEGCAQLNKDFLNCDDLQNKPDYQLATQCTPEDIDPSSPSPVVLPCDGKPQPTSKQKNCHLEEDGGNEDLCGLVTVNYKCVNDEWVSYDYPSCTPRYSEKKDPCECGPDITTPYECSETTHSWVLGTPSQEKCLEKPEGEQPCEVGEGKEIRDVWCENKTEWKTSEWDKTGCVLPQNGCEDFAGKKFAMTWDQACAYGYGPDGNKIKNPNYEGNVITSKTDFMAKCCQEPRTCTEWVHTWVLQGQDGWEGQCRASARLKNPAAADLVVNMTDFDEFSEKCCLPSPYKTAKGYVVEVDWTGNWKSGATKKEKAYYTASGLNMSGFIQGEGGSSCASGTDPGCYVTSDCTWGDECFKNTEPLTQMPSLKNVNEPSDNDDDFCFPCNEGKCPDVANAQRSIVMAHEGYAYAGGHKGSDPCANHDGLGDLGNNNSAITYSETCTDIPVDISAAESLMENAAKCKDAVKDGGSIGCGGSERNWMDLIQTADMVFKMQIGCPGHDTGKTCSSKMFLFYRPRITMYPRYYCVHK